MAADKLHSTVFLSAAEPQWCDVKAWANKQLAVHRRNLEIIGLSPIETEGERYVIAELEALLNLPNPSKMQGIETEAP